jgi:hypothetical protein
MFLRLIFIFIGFCYSSNLFSQCAGTATAASSGNWNAGPGASKATWTFTGGATSPNDACTIIIPFGITVTINNNQTWIGSVEINGVLDLGNQLNLGTTTGCGLTLKIFGAGLLAGNGSSDRLIICGKTVVSGQPVPPAGAIDWPADGSFSASDLGGAGGGFGETGVLPIELLFFTANTFKESVKLNWATASELNFDFFSIEKSIDGLNFKEISKVKGYGTTTDRQDYSLVDEKPYLGKNYYRLKSVDFDGYSEYFDVVMVYFDRMKGFSVYPNPA